MRVTQRCALVLAACASAAIAVGSVAWACTPLASIQADAVPGVPEGSRAKVVGQSFTPGAPVEVRWDTASGPLLATATGPDFATEVAIPADAGHGAHYIVAIGGGERQYKAVDTFEIGTGGAVHDGWNSSPVSSSPAGSAGDALVPGVALLTGGLVMLAGGTALVATKRARRLAGTSGSAGR